MSATTTKGVPYPEPGDPANVPADLQALAAWADTHPGVTALTATQITALPAGQKWAGRAVWDTTNTRALIWDGAAWRRLTTEATPDAAWQTWTPALTGITASSVSARYRAQGRTCHAKVRLSSVAQLAPGPRAVALPVAASTWAQGVVSGLVWFDSETVPVIAVVDADDVGLEMPSGAWDGDLSIDLCYETV